MNFKIALSHKKLLWTVLIEIIKFTRIETEELIKKLFELFLKKFFIKKFKHFNEEFKISQVGTKYKLFSILYLSSILYIGPSSR